MKTFEEIPDKISDMIENDEISLEEEGFMRGFEKEPYDEEW